MPLAAAAAVCVEGAFLARLEGPAIDNLVLRVSGTRAASGHGLFVYRVERRTLVPRFLGSGFSGLRIDSAVAAPGAIEIEAHDGSGPSRFTCRFHGFPLVCSEKGLP